MSILPSERDSGKRRNVWVDFASIHELESRKERDLILRTVRKWVDSLENFGQYVVRRLQKMGILCEFSSSISPIPEGFHISITVKVRGVDRDKMKAFLPTIRRSGNDKSLSSKEYRKFEEGMNNE